MPSNIVGRGKVLLPGIHCGDVLAASSTKLGILWKIVSRDEIVVDATDEVYRLIEGRADGLDNDTLNQLTPNLSAKERQDAINQLLAQQKLDLIQVAGQIRFKLKSGTQLEGVSQEEQLIYQLIEESSTSGIWIRELRDGSGLSQLQLRKVLKQLETRKLIKTVKAVGTTKKCYMLSQLEPSTSLTGGTFILTDNSMRNLFNLCFLNMKRNEAREVAASNLEMQKELSLIANFVTEKRLLNVTVTEEDIDRILEIAVLDGSAERRPDGRVRATAHVPEASPLVLIPCATCPVIDDCKPGHVIAPETCQYMRDWLGTTANVI
ncbi:unnamed protein product, partial [Mesorhabditis spiculigera]